MKITISSLLCLLCVSFCSLPTSAEETPADEVPTALFDYVRRPEPEYAWEIRDVQSLAGGRLYDVELTSQQWQGITWKHDLQIHEPAVMDHPEHVLLFVTGGSNGRRPGRGETEMGVRLARLTSSRVAVLYQVPNQPLMGNRFEDDLITETWLRYLDTGDETWPLLFPMVKSAVKAMDAIEAIAGQRWNGAVKGFVITGASKRGWTSWLTPVADKRVIATAPIVIDVLNFRAQMKHQLDTWGRYSEQIKDYSSKGLIQEGTESPRETQLRLMMDPYTYRHRLPLPKLLVNGTNDPYWVVDAMRWYWDDLVGPKYVLQVPNAGHGLDEGRQRALATVAAFFRHAAAETPLPEIRWEHQAAANGTTLKIQTSQQPVTARLWVAESDTKDFRKSTWRSRPLTKASDSYAGEVAKPATGYVAYFGELEFLGYGIPYSLCTVIQRN
jgi:PhoPQ-activated pathogenicity-related protein